MKEFEIAFPDICGEEFDNMRTVNRLSDKERLQKSKKKAKKKLLREILEVLRNPTIKSDIEWAEWKTKRDRLIRKLEKGGI